MSTTVGTYEAKTRLPSLIRRVEQGETVIITRHGKPVAQLGPVQDRRREDVAKVLARMRELRSRLPKVSVEEILSARDEGRKP